MPRQRKRSKSTSSISSLIYFDNNYAKNLIEKKYDMCNSFDDLYNEEYIEFGPLVKSEKSQNFLMKLISNFDKKNKYKSSGEKDANNEFLKQSFMKTSIPRITSPHYHDSSNKDVQPKLSTYDKTDKILSNKNPFLSKRYSEIFERNIENDDSFLTDQLASPIVNKISDKENWNNKNKHWDETVINKKSNHKKNFKEKLSSFMRINKNVNKQINEKNQFYNKYEMNNALYNIPIIPRVAQMVSNDDNNKDKDNIDINRSATIRPIYGIKRNQTTPVKSMETFLSKDITLDKETSNYNNEILSNEEYEENLIKPSAIKKWARQYILNTPQICYQREQLNYTKHQSQFPSPNENHSQNKNTSPNQNELPNQNKNQTGNTYLNQLEHPNQFNIHKNHVELCKLVLNTCRKEKYSSHVRPFFNELNDFQTTKQNGNRIFERTSHQMICECNVQFKQMKFENV